MHIACRMNLRVGDAASRVDKREIRPSQGPRRNPLAPRYNEVVEQTTSLADFAAAPLGRILVGRGFATFCAHERLWGFGLAGTLAVDDVRALVEALRLELEPHIAPHASLVDASALVSVDDAGFAVLQRYVTEQHQALGRAVTALAVVRPPAGLPGALVAGFFGVLRPPYPVFVVERVDEGLRALGVGGNDVGAFADGVGDALADALGASGAVPLVERVRALLKADPRLAPDRLARRLGLSLRTLQRQLGAHGTSTSALAADARLALALVAIEQGSAPLTSVALDAGYASLQHMARAVRAATGRAPSALRAEAHG